MEFVNDLWVVNTALDNSAFMPVRIVLVSSRVSNSWFMILEKTFLYPYDMYFYMSKAE